MQDRPVLITDKELPELIRNGTIEMIGVPSACWLGVPLHIDGKVIGAFVVQSYDNPNAYSVKDMEILEFVSDQISLAVQRKQTEAELITAKESAQESDRLKSAFLANMSHEIRTPMNAIVGFAGMLSDPEVSPEERNRFSGIIQSRSDDLMHIINDLLEISRIESGNAIVVKSTISINAVLDEMETIFRQKLDKNNKGHLSIFTEKAWTDFRSEIITDGYILRQVFSNLIDNAIKYTSAGSIRFGYQVPKNGFISFFVSDTGVGIARQNQNVIFEHFRQADTPDQHKYGGTGLGLSICKGSLALLGGNIRVESEPGKGSTFYFNIPFEAPEPRIQDPVSNRSQGHTSQHTYDWAGKTVLLVEDDETNMDFLRIVLKSTKANLLFATSGSEVRKHFDQLRSIDLVLLDIRLPDANGWDLTVEIKALRPDLPVIAQTAFAMSSDRQKSMEAGCDNYLSKPISKQLLLVMLAGYLDGDNKQ
jgi:signal transduction histidine kinase/ActR/RegA family two-component response regulator